MRKILSTLAVSSVMLVGTAQAEQPGQGSFALTLTHMSFAESLTAVLPGDFDPFTGDFEGGGVASMSSLEEMTYNVGFFLTDDIMPYGAIRVHSGDDTAVLLRGGSRFYQLPGDTGNLRTFVDGEVTIFADGVDVFGIAGHLGAEYNVARHFSVSGRVGAELFDADPGDTTFNLGVAHVSINFYL
ncbi:hypothetical protein [Aquisalimonas sp.]|uniref:hypothetical protein n=1 Tax=Aquisalimonas sp. TaxID=1872621 RepID=UPI0025B9EDE3|nr:hypothetical protein [Aquisalimonas sp.]